MPDDNVHYLGCPINNMGCTLDDLQAMVKAGEITGLHICGIRKVNGEELILNAMILTDDTPYYTLLGGIQTAATKLAHDLSHQVSVVKPDGSLEE